MAAVNSEGEVPSDIAEEAAMKDLLLEQVKKQGKERAWVSERDPGEFLYENSAALLSVGEGIQGLAQEAADKFYFTTRTVEQMQEVCGLCL